MTAQIAAPNRFQLRSLFLIAFPAAGELSHCAAAYGIAAYGVAVCDTIKLIMAKRIIVISPKFERLDLIEQIRSLFDPLAVSTEAHITLVFPFESDASSEQLHSHIKEATRNIHPFQLKLQGITGYEGEYLFLNVKEGNDQIIELHDKLYTGVLAPHLLHSHTYVPHLTVGRLPDNDSFLQALAKMKEFAATFETQVNEISACSIHADGSDQIDFTVVL